EVSVAPDALAERRHRPVFARREAARRGDHGGAGGGTGAAAVRRAARRTQRGRLPRLARRERRPRLVPRFGPALIRRVQLFEAFAGCAGGVAIGSTVLRATRASDALDGESTLATYSASDGGRHRH